MSRAMIRRLGRLEAAPAAVVAVPCVITVLSGQAVAAALASHAAAHPVRPRRFAPLVVPAKPSTNTERQRFAERFAASQLKLRNEARSERLAASPLLIGFDQVAERVAVNRAREVIAAAKVPPKKPTFSAANFNSRPLRAAVKALRDK